MTTSPLTQPSTASRPDAATVARLANELQETLRIHEERLLVPPEPDDVSMAIRRQEIRGRDEIVAALARIDNGTYGICERCAGPITTGRLEFMAHTKFCVTCAGRPNDR